MTTRLLRLLPVVAALALALALAGSPESSLVAGGLVAATAVAVGVAVLAVRAPVSTAVGGAPGAHRPLVDGAPAPAHPGTPGRARSRAPGRGPLAASS